MTSTAQPLVTVGVTSYNEAGVIARCLESIRNQTLAPEHIEVMVVDDASSDKTRSIARQSGTDKWADFTVSKHRRAKTPSRGRNTILEQARGRYVFFLDGDDHLGPEALQAMTDSAQRHRSDVVVGRYVGVNRFAPNVTGAESLPAVHDYHAGWLNSLHVQKLFRTDFIRGLDYRFNESLIYASDHPFMISAFLHADRVSFVNDVDCYFIELGKTGGQQLDQGHVSRADISPKDQFRFLHDCFGTLAHGRGRRETSTRAAKMRAHYWSRLLRVHIPALVQRKQSLEQVAALADEALYVAELYGAATQRVPPGDKANRFLQALRSGDPEVVQAAANEQRANVDSSSQGA